MGIQWQPCCCGPDNFYYSGSGQLHRYRTDLRQYVGGVATTLARKLWSFALGDPKNPFGISPTQHVHFVGSKASGELRAHFYGTRGSPTELRWAVMDLPTRNNLSMGPDLASASYLDLRSTVQTAIDPVRGEVYFSGAVNSDINPVSAHIVWRASIDGSGAAQIINSATDTGYGAVGPGPFSQSHQATFMPRTIWSNPYVTVSSLSIVRISRTGAVTVLASETPGGTVTHMAYDPESDNVYYAAYPPAPPYFIKRVSGSGGSSEIVAEFSGTTIDNNRLTGGVPQHIQIDVPGRRILYGRGFPDTTFRSEIWEIGIGNEAFNRVAIPYDRFAGLVTGSNSWHAGHGLIDPITKDWVQ